MEQHLRDTELSNLIIEENTLKLAAHFLEKQKEKINKMDEENQAVNKYTIRYDQKGYQLNDPDDLLNHFNRAKNIERIILTLETKSSRQTNKLQGSFINVSLETTLPTKSSLTSKSESEDWVNNSFLSLQDILLSNKAGSIQRILQTNFFEAVLQFSALVIFFLLSLFLAKLTSPKISTHNSFLICFLFWLLIYSNLWAYMKSPLTQLKNKLLPNIKFYRPNKDHTLFIETLISGIAATATIAVISLAANSLIKILFNIIGHHP